MDFINPLVAQIRELFASMTPGARVTAGLLMAVVVVSFGFLFQQAASGPDEYLFGGTPVGRDRLPRVEAAIAQAGIDYEVQSGRIKVAKSKKNEAVAAVMAAGELPHDFFSLMDEAISKGSVLEYRGTRDQRIRAAREHQISLVLNGLQWVDWATVIHNVSERQGLRNTVQSSAAVSILPRVGESLTPKRLRMIKEHVSKACLVPIDQVVVTNQGPDLLAGGDGTGTSPEDMDNPYFRNKAIQENEIRDSILMNLADIPGVRVQVNARLDNVSAMQTKSVKPEPEAVTVSSSTVTETESRTSGRPGERVGLEQNGPIQAPDDASLANTDRSERSNDVADKQSVVGSSVEIRTMAGFELKEAEASVVIPESYVDSVYRQENADENGEVPTPIDPTALAQTRETIQKKVEDIVKPLLPKLALGQDEYTQVSVTFMRDLPKTPMPKPSMATGALTLLGDYGGTAAMFGLAAFSLVMLRSVVNGGSTSATPAGLPSLALEANEADAAEDEEMEAQRPKLKLRKADTLKDDLTEMVASDPDAAAAILRSWINNASSSSPGNGTSNNNAA